MNPRTTLLLLAAVILLGIYIQFGERRRDNTEERKAAARLAVRFEPESVRLLRLESPAGLFILEKTNLTWRLVSPVQANADDAAVMRILDTLAGLRRSEIITPEEMESLKLDRSEYGFNPPRVKITLAGEQGESTILIGRDAPGGRQLYVQHGDLEDIIVTSRDILATLPNSVLDMRDRRLFSGKPGSIRRIELQSGENIFHASRNESDQWNLDRPVYARGASGVIRQWLEGLYEFRISDFIADSVAAGSLYGFDTPSAQLSLLTDNRAVPQVLKIGRAADAGETSFYATLIGQDAVFAISRDVADWLKKNPSEFRDNRLLAIPAMNIGFIQMSDGERILQLARSTQEVWEVISPKRFAADDVKIQRLLSTWSGAKVNRFSDQPADRAAAEEPRTSIRFALHLPSTASTDMAASTNNHGLASEYVDVTFMISRTNDETTAIITRAGQSQRMEVTAALLDTITLNPLDFRDPVILSIPADDIRRISQKTTASETFVERTNALFRTRTPQEVPDTGAIDQIISEVTRLIAARLIAEDPPDLSIYGLDTPSKQLILGLSGTSGINKVIQFGTPTGTGETHAKIQGTDMVFTLPDVLVEVLMTPVSNPLSPTGIPAQAPVTE